MSEAIRVYRREHEQFGSIRFVEMDGEVWFYATDVAKSLGYKNTRDAVISHCTDAKTLNECSTSRNVTTRIIDESGKEFSLPKHPPKIIPESDMYALVISSKLPKAREFRDWVFKEVLPSIASTGSYHKGVKTAAELILSQAEVLVQHEREMNELKGKVAHIDKRLSDVEVNQGDFFDDVEDVVLSLTDPSDMDLRSKMNIAVRKHCKKSSLSFSGMWNKIYTQFKYREHVDLKARAKNSGMKPLDICDELGLMESLWDVVSFCIRRDEGKNPNDRRTRLPHFRDRGAVFRQNTLPSDDEEPN